ncbi:MAG: GMC oxidoreductase [Planctomycetaceae bacterium]
MSPIPQSQWSSRTHLVHDAANAIGAGNRFRTIPLAINFGAALTINPASANRLERNPASIKPNHRGVPQGECYHCGECDIGCDVNARNTLDTNYIPLAESTGRATVLPLHIVRNIEPISNGYRVAYERIRDGTLYPGSLTSRLVIVAAGSLGSTELLLRCRDVTGTLRGLSPRLGKNWTSNGDFLTPAIYAMRNPPPFPSDGPTITAVIDFLDRSQSDQSFWIQDGGFPNLLLVWLAGLGRGLPGPRNWMLLDSLRAVIAGMASAGKTVAQQARAGELSQIMPWFAQSVDAGDGQLSLKRRWWLFGARQLDLKWEITRSEPAINAVVEMHKKLCAATGGLPLVPASWSIFKDLITPHPLGGCSMADAPTMGVVNDAGEVFGYRNLFVADGAVFPRAIGVNPSRTIGALAERIAARIVAGDR